MRIVLTALLSLFVLSLSAQNALTTTEDYLRYTDSAQKLYKVKDYKASALLYDQAFEANGTTGSADDHYSAACSWARAGHHEKAITHLEVAVVLKWSGVVHMQKDSDLESIRSDKRWAQIVAEAQKNKEEKEARLDRALAAQLDTIFREDQALRHQVESIKKQYGWESKEMKELWAAINAKDSVNQLKVKHILDTRGWPGTEIIGGKGSQALFLVIQHADSATQEKYLPLLRQAVQQGKAQPSNLALLEDRTRVRRGEKQLYGSQLKTDPATGKDVLVPIEDEPNVNKRRAAIGMEPLEQYLKRFGVEYTLPTKN